MHKELESQFWKSRSRYQFNIDRIAEKYCGSNKRDLALEALQRNFGEACISSPVVGLKDKSYKAICRHLNKFNNTAPPNIVNMLTNSVKEEKYRSEVKRLRVGPVSCRVIDVITSPVKEGPVEIHVLILSALENYSNNILLCLNFFKNKKYELHAMANSVLDLCNAQSSSSMERFTVTKNGKFLEAWFNNAERYWTNTNFVRDHSLRWRAAYNARRNIHHNLGYVNMSDH
uniref:Uncharacterized protein n=1 Tax=Onchocerca volvulus TaxID=6282 RepID=A0A8R1Y2V4_ONCVO